MAGVEHRREHPRGDVRARVLVRVKHDAGGGETRRGRIRQRLPPRRSLTSRAMPRRLASEVSESVSASFWKCRWASAFASASSMMRTIATHRDSSWSETVRLRPATASTPWSSPSTITGTHPPCPTPWSRASDRTAGPSSAGSRAPDVATRFRTAWARSGLQSRRDAALRPEQERERKEIPTGRDKRNPGGRPEPGQHRGQPDHNCEHAAAGPERRHRAGSWKRHGR